MDLKDLTNAAYLCNKFPVIWKKENAIAIFGTVLLAVFSFQFLGSSAIALGLLPDACAALHATSPYADSVVSHSEDDSTNSSSEHSNHCSCSCHHPAFVGFFVSQCDFSINSAVQDKVAADDDFPSDGLARLIYLPPRLS